MNPAPASPDGTGVVVVANPSSGTAVVRTSPLAAFVERMPRAEVHELADGESPADAARAAVDRDDPPAVVGVCGGDGSVTAVAHVARTAGFPLLVVPSGTFNHFARTAGVDSADAAADALARGSTRRADVAELSVDGGEPVTVLNAASVGVYPDFVAERERLRPRWGKWLGGVIAARRVLTGARPVAVTLNGRRARVWAVFVGVGPNDRGIPAPLQRRQLDGGVLDVRLLHAGRGSRRHAIAALAFGRRTSAVLRFLRLLPERVESFTATSLDVAVRTEDGGAPEFGYDGELLPVSRGTTTHRMSVRVLPAALEVYAPPPAGRG